MESNTVIRPKYQLLLQRDDLKESDCEEPKKWQMATADLLNTLIPLRRSEILNIAIPGHLNNRWTGDVPGATNQ